MVDIKVRAPIAEKHVDDGNVVLERGRLSIGSLDLSAIPGNKWTAKRLAKLSEAAQELADTYRLIADLEDIDPDKVAALALDHDWFTARYGGRMFISGDYLVSRSDMITFTLVDGDVVPTVRVVL